MKGKNWEKPKLVILVRGTEQEDVLANCKRTASYQGESGNIDDSCKNQVCNNCSSIGTS